MEDPETKDVILNLFDFESQETEELRVDLAILSPALVPSRGTEKLSKMLEIELDENGFLKEKSADAINETNRPGIFVAGFAQGPKDIPDTVAQASGAAAKVEGVLASARGTLIEEPPVYEIKEVKPDEEPRIGVMICHCGINIAGVVNVPEVLEYTKTLPNVVVAVENKYACSSEAQNVIKDEMIREHNLNRFVVAACTPRTHEPLFQTTCEEAGLNPYLFEFANIREHDSWVHMRQPKEATEKAKDLVRMYVSKAQYLQPLVKGEIDLIQKVLVIGGGIAGMTAALDSADQGFETYLIEKQSELGGLLKDLHKIAPADENAADIIRKKIKAVKEHHNIKVFLNTEIENIEGFVGNFNIKLSIGNSEKKEIRIGAIIVATGAKIFEPVEMYGYGTNNNIITQLELEQRLKNNEINDLKNVLMIQCVGAREKERRTYCSRICCTAAIKNAMTLREKFPTAKIYVLNRDIIMPAKGLEEYYRLARSKNITFIRFHEDKPPVVTSENDSVKVNVYDTSAKVELCMDCDLLVLSTPLVSQDDAINLQKQLKVPLGQDSFFLEAHMKLRPLDFATDGIYICGTAHYPKSVSEATAQASGAASRATIVLSKGVIETIGFVSVIDEEKCIGCGTCVSICPYSAIETVEVFKKFEDISLKEVKSRINPALCKGCGMCRPACPVGMRNVPSSLPSRCYFSKALH
jgi:heterodisulfide reductase subunit A